jgi:oligoribonuclease (3'-5' exoribonuclease)
MKRYDLWDAFSKTGRIEDYLRYRGVDVYNLKNVNRGREERERNDNRRPDNQGEQQYW